VAGRRDGPAACSGLCGLMRLGGPGRKKKKEDGPRWAGMREGRESREVWFFFSFFCFFFKYFFSNFQKFKLFQNFFFQLLNSFPKISNKFKNF
jgi:hypothetical protein